MGLDIYPTTRCFCLGRENRSEPKIIQSRKKCVSTLVNGWIYFLRPVKPKNLNWIDDEPLIYITFKFFFLATISSWLEWWFRVRISRKKLSTRSNRGHWQVTHCVVSTLTSYLGGHVWLGPKWSKIFPKKWGKLCQISTWLSFSSLFRVFIFPVPFVSQPNNLSKFDHCDFYLAYCFESLTNINKIVLKKIPKNYPDPNDFSFWLL